MLSYVNSTGTKPELGNWFGFQTEPQPGRLSYLFGVSMHTCSYVYRCTHIHGLACEDQRLTLVVSPHPYSLSTLYIFWDSFFFSESKTFWVTSTGCSESPRAPPTSASLALDISLSAGDLNFGPNAYIALDLLSIFLPFHLHLLTSKCKYRVPCPSETGGASHSPYRKT